MAFNYFGLLAYQTILQSFVESEQHMITITLCAKLIPENIIRNKVLSNISFRLIVIDSTKLIKEIGTYLSFHLECIRFQTEFGLSRMVQSRHPIRRGCRSLCHSYDSLSDYAVAHQAVPKAGLRQGDSLKSKKITKLIKRKRQKLKNE